MSDGTRFEIRLSAARRRELGELANETGLTAADVARLAIVRLLNDPQVLTGRTVEREAA